jgi:hypothetical protein
MSVAILDFESAPIESPQSEHVPYRAGVAKKGNEANFRLSKDDMKEIAEAVWIRLQAWSFPTTQCY